ncbi:hypothetical protein SAMN06266787_11629, partial [Halorubrum ezzemoulense]
MTNSPDRTSMPDGGSLRRRDDSNEGDNGFD